MSDIKEFLGEKKNEIINLYQNQSVKGIFNVYKDVIDRINNVSTFYEFFAETFLIDPDFYMEKVFKLYNQNITNILTLESVFDLETFVLQNHCFYEDEKMKAIFPGQIMIGVMKPTGKIVGRIYLTNFRIILAGSIKGKGIPMVTTSLGAYLFNKSIHKSIMKKMQSIISKSTSSELPCFGYQYPFFGVQEIASGKKSVGYRLAFHYEDYSYLHGYTNTKTYVINIKPHVNNPGKILKLLYNTINEYNEMTT